MKASERRSRETFCHCGLMNSAVWAVGIRNGKFKARCVERYNIDFEFGPEGKRYVNQIFMRIYITSLLFDCIKVKYAYY